jgi:multiple sugar transport system substrate-binding protein
MRNDNSFLALITGVAIGAVAGLLLAPDKGSETYRRVKETARDFSDKLKDQYEEGLDLQVVTLPTWPDRPGVGAEMHGHELTINPHGDHIDAAFQVISYFTTDEYQLWASRNGVGPVVRNPEVHKHWCSERHPNIENINTDAIFNLEPASTYVSRWDQYVDINPHEIIQSDLDHVSYLRQVVEESTTRIEEAKVAE